jgi:hypothetical protein
MMGIMHDQQRVRGRMDTDGLEINTPQRQGYRVADYLTERHTTPELNGPERLAYTNRIAELEAKVDRLQQLLALYEPVDPGERERLPGYGTYYTYDFNVTGSRLSPNNRCVQWPFPTGFRSYSIRGTYDSCSSYYTYDRQLRQATIAAAGAAAAVSRAQQDCLLVRVDSPYPCGADISRA